jgi:hypothetical protein
MFLVRVIRRSFVCGFARSRADCARRVRPSPQWVGVFSAPRNLRGTGSVLPAVDRSYRSGSIFRGFAVGSEPARHRNESIRPLQSRFHTFGLGYPAGIHRVERHRAFVPDLHLITVGIEKEDVRLARTEFALFALVEDRAARPLDSLSERSDVLWPDESESEMQNPGRAMLD